MKNRTKNVPSKVPSHHKSSLGVFRGESSGVNSVINEETDDFVSTSSNVVSNSEALSGSKSVNIHVEKADG